MRYTTVFMDIDNTVLDFSTAQRAAFFRTFPGFDAEKFETFERINRANWRRLERGEATRGQILHDRFVWFFNEIGSTRDPDEANRSYLDALALDSSVVPGAREALRELSTLARLAAVTNGVTHVQRQRLHDSGLEGYFAAVVVSEQVGADKPDPRIFDEALRRCGVCDRREVLVIGDSLTSDIAGGIASGLDTCWFNPASLPCPDNVAPTYVTHSPAEWAELVK